MDVCPFCGKLAVLDEITGWCPECSGTGQLKTYTCVRCRKSFDSSLMEFICSSCKVEDWANEIEEVMGKFKVSFTKAKQLVAQSNQAVCLCCRKKMPRATKGRHYFCTSKKKCRSASRRVKHLRMSRGLAYEDALHIVLLELNPENKAA